MKKINVLIRIPKCGSSSLELMVEQGLPKSRHFRLPSLGKRPDTNLLAKLRRERNFFTGKLRYNAFRESTMWKKISQQASNNDIISSHMPYGQPQLDGWHLNYITLLRDPVEQLTSRYFYNRYGYKKLPAWRKLYRTGEYKVVGTKSLSDYIKYLYEHREQFKNPMTMFVTGVPNHPDAYQFLLDNYFHFGVLENIDLFAQQLGSKMRCEIPVLVTNVNADKKTPNFSDREYSMMHDLLGKDIDLYEKTKKYVMRNVPDSL